MDTLNTLQQAYTEQQNENQTAQSYPFTFKNVHTTMYSSAWTPYTFSSTSQGDKPYMEDYLGVYSLTNFKSSNEIQYLANILYLSLYLLGDLLFFFDSGSTVVCALHNHRHIVVGNLGDSRANLLQYTAHKENVLRLTRIHQINNPHEQKRLKEEALKWGNRNIENLILSRGLGGFGYCPLVCYEPEISFLDIHDDSSTLLLVSDGVSDVLNEKEMTPFCSVNISLLPKIIHDTAYNIFKLKNKSADNICAVAHKIDIRSKIISLICVCDGCGGGEVAKIASRLLPILVSPTILEIEDQFTPWREIYNNLVNYNSDWIRKMKYESKKLINLLLNRKLPLKTIMIKWQMLKENYIKQIP